ncbi:hypothetical protein GGG16DRAFT_87735 [Schizophyllum commune]
MSSQTTYYAGGVAPRRPSHSRTSSRDGLSYPGVHPYSRPSPAGAASAMDHYFSPTYPAYPSTPADTHSWAASPASSYSLSPVQSMPPYRAGSYVHPPLAVAHATASQYPPEDSSPTIQDLEEFLNDPNLWTPPTAAQYNSSYRSMAPAAPTGGPPTPPEKICWHCRTRTTPLWRRDPRIPGLLCNACGLYLSQRGKLRPRELIDADDDSDVVREANYSGPECSHCHTRTTSVWRRNKVGAQVCNACGVYERLKGKERPLSLRRDKIRPRNTGND